MTLWRPTGPKELALVEASGWREWPPRLPGQPIFDPVLNEEYAAKIARDWNVPRSGAGYVTRFQVLRSFLDQYEVHQAGGKTLNDDQDARQTGDYSLVRRCVRSPIRSPQNIRLWGPGARRRRGLIRPCGSSVSWYVRCSIRA